MISWCLCLIPFLAAVMMVLGWPIAPDYDLYFHLRAGERVAAIGGPLLKDIFTYTVTGTPDEAWHSWLSQLFFWKIYSRAGFSGLKTLNVVTVWVTLLSVSWFVGKKTKQSGLTLFATTLALLIHQHIQILRPLLFGEMLFSMMVFLLIPFEKSLGFLRLFGMVILTIVWANLHGSVVVVPFLFFAYALGAWFERKEQKQSYVTYLSPLLVLLASFVNPKGPGLYLYSYQLTQLGKLAGNAEWGGIAPFSVTAGLSEPYLLTLNLDVLSIGILFGLLGCVVLILQGCWRGLFVSLFCLILPFISIRHGTYLLFPVVYSLSELPRWWALRAGATASSFRPLLPLLFSLILLFGYRFYQSQDVIPSVEKTSQFVERAGLEGNVFCEPAWSNYLLFKNYPRLLVAADNRTFVHRAFFLKARDLYAKYGYDAWNLMIAEAPPQTDFLLISSWRDNPPYDPTQWLVIYENNHSTLLLKRNDRNLPQIEKVKSYYSQNQIPFNEMEGFTSRAAFWANRKWFEEQLEVMPWGKWPQEAAVKQWENRQKKFYESRKLFEKKPLG